jgi:hypothetical protein
MRHFEIFWIHTKKPHLLSKKRIIKKKMLTRLDEDGLTAIIAGLIGLSLQYYAAKPVQTKLNI